MNQTRIIAYFYLFIAKVYTVHQLDDGVTFIDVQPLQKIMAVVDSSSWYHWSWQSS